MTQFDHLTIDSITPTGCLRARGGGEFMCRIPREPTTKDIKSIASLLRGTQVLDVGTSKVGIQDVVAVTAVLPSLLCLRFLDFPIHRGVARPLPRWRQDVVVFLSSVSESARETVRTVGEGLRPLIAPGVERVVITIEGDRNQAGIPWDLVKWMLRVPPCVGEVMAHLFDTCTDKGVDSACSYAAYAYLGSHEVVLGTKSRLQVTVVGGTVPIPMEGGTAGQFRPERANGLVLMGMMEIITMIEGGRPLIDPDSVHESRYGEEKA